MFGHPSQRDHMMNGVRGALSSPRTPPHLKPHLQKRLGGSMNGLKGNPLSGFMQPLGADSSSVRTPRPKGVGTSAPVRTPRPKGVGTSAGLNLPPPRGVPRSQVTIKSPKGVGSSGPLRLPSPKGVGSLSSVIAPQGTDNDRGGGGAPPSSLRPAPAMGNATMDLGKLRSAIDNVPKSETNPSYQRLRPLSKVNRGFGKSKNLNSAPNAMFGEY